VSSSVILGTGSYLPARIVTNDEIERLSRDFDPHRAGSTLDDWCRTRMGAVERRRVAPGEGSADMATQAAHAALDQAGIAPADLDLIVLATITNDYPVPPTAALVQRNLRTSARFIQLDSACTGFIDSLMLADALMGQMHFRTALVVGTDTMSHLMDSERFREQAIFGDGAGAAVVGRVDDDSYGIKAFSTGSSGAEGHLVEVRAGGTKLPLTLGTIDDRLQYMRIASEIPTYGVQKMVQAITEVLDRAGVTMCDVDWIVPHQASMNILRSVACELDVPMERLVVEFEKVGNTSAGSIPLALDHANRAGCFRDGQKIVLPSVGAGMAWGAAYLVWREIRRV
jgi:3-oxoacyl-[acyl-carrier-protein] synthase III